MDSSLELIRVKIADLETKLANLRIAEQELQKLEKSSPAPRSPKAASKGVKKAGRKSVPAKTEEAAPKQTIGATIIGVLSQHGTLPAKSISEQIAASGKDINNRAVSFALQAMKKHGLVKSSDGAWTLTRSGVKRAGA